jgi:hypothetical protein
MKIVSAAARTRSNNNSAVAALTAVMVTLKVGFGSYQTLNV